MPADILLIQPQDVIEIVLSVSSGQRSQLSEADLKRAMSNDPDKERTAE